MYTISSSNVVYLVLHGGVGWLILLLLFSAVISCMIKWSDHFVQLNHIFKSRDLIVKNERKLAKNQESVESKTFDDDAYRDRGFTRPKVHSSVLMPCSYGIESSSSMIVALLHDIFFDPWSLITYLWLGIQCLIVYINLWFFTVINLGFLIYFKLYNGLKKTFHYIWKIM